MTNITPQTRFCRETLPPLLVHDELSEKNCKRVLRTTRQNRCRKKSKKVVSRDKTVQQERKATAIKVILPSAQNPGVMKESDQIQSKEKKELAAKAKKKFLDNLSKFQKESKLSNASKPPFQRSSFKIDDNVSKDNFRRSYRVPSTQPLQKDSNHLPRQSLRKTRDTEVGSDSDKSNSNRNSTGKGKTKRKSLDKVHLNANHESQEVKRLSDDSPKSPSSSDFLETESFVISADTMTSLQVSSPTSSSMTSDTTVSRSSNHQRSLSRAEEAMEKHKERMRKASLPALSQTQVVQIPRQQLTPKAKRRNQTPDFPKSDVKSKTGNQKFGETEDKRKNKTNDAILSSAHNTHTKSSMSTWHSIKVVEADQLDASSLSLKDKLEEQNSFDLLDIRSPMIKRKNPARTNRKPKTNKTSSVRSNKQQVSRQNLNPPKKNHLLPDSSFGSFQDMAAHNGSSLPLRHRTVVDDDNHDGNKTAPKKSNNVAKNDEKGPSANNLDNIDLHFKETSDNNQFVQEWVSQQQITTKTKASSITSHKFSRENPIGTHKAIENYPHEENISHILPDKPLIFHVKSPSNDASNHPHEVNTKSDAHSNNASGSSSISGSTSLKKETKKSSSAKKEKKNKKLAQRINENGAVGSESKPEAASKPTIPKAEAKLKLSSGKETKVDSNGILREKLVLDYKSPRQQRINSAPAKRSIDETMSVAAPVTSRSFRSLSASQRRKKLQRVLVKYQKEYDSDSPLSEGSGDESDIDMKWLENDGNDSTSSADIDKWLNSSTPLKREKQERKKFEEKVPTEHSQCNGTEKVVENGHNSSTKNGDSSNDSPLPSTRNMKSLWENKATETYKPTRSPVEAELEGDRRNKVEEAKAALVSPTKKNPNESSLSPENENSRNGELENDTKEPKKVTSMLSMWESRKDREHSGFDATKDEAFDTDTMGRLQGAKALFQRMSIKRKDQERPVIAPTRGGRRRNVKDVFENNSTGHEATKTSPEENQSPPLESSSEPVASPTIKSASEVPLKTMQEEEPKVESKDENKSETPKTSKRSRGLSADDWLENDDLSDVATLSSATTSEDESETTEVQNVRTMWERRSSQKNMETSDDSGSRKKSSRNSQSSAKEDSSSVPEAWEENDVN